MFSQNPSGSSLVRVDNTGDQIFTNLTVGTRSAVLSLGASIAATANAEFDIAEIINYSGNHVSWTDDGLRVRQYLRNEYNLW